MDQSSATRLLDTYRADLAAFRRENGPVRSLPAVSFYLFGMGPRRKLIYQDGMLRDARSGEILRRWDVVREIILPAEYTVLLETHSGATVQIFENEEGTWLSEGGDPAALSRSTLRLPDFAGVRHAPILRVLHQEMLVNLVEEGPVPNFLVYRKPWYRDAAMMAMALQRTGNLDLLRGWIESLEEPYDRNNAGETEADNLGQALYLLSLAGGSSHPLVPVLLEEMERFRDGKFLRGRSDFAEHPVYQTQWAKFGLQVLGLPDALEAPLLPDSYSALFWWDYQDRHVEGARFHELDYPYLDWAEAHFYGEHGGPTGDRDYPLSWEANASQADYAGMGILSPLYVEQKLCAPHTWHAAEMFLYLIDLM
jgi:hypothetical protein